MVNYTLMYNQWYSVTAIWLLSSLYFTRSCWFWSMSKTIMKEIEIN